MKKIRKMIISIVCVGVVGFTPCLTVFADNEDSLTEAQEEKAALESELAEVQKLIDALGKNKSGKQEEVDALNEKLTEISGKVSALETQLQTKRKEIADVESVYLEAKEKEQKQYEDMKLRIQFMYEHGKASYIEMLLSAENFADIISAAEYMIQITRYDRKMMKEYQNTQETVAVTQAALEEEYESLQAMEAEVEAERRAIASIEAAKKGELADLSGELASAEEIARVYEAEIQAQNEVIAQIRAAQSNPTPAPEENENAENAENAGGVAGAATGTMTWPCPSSRRVTSDYGPRVSPTSGASSNHKGIDIGAPAGSAIVAADGGTVIVARYSNSAGNYVIIDHGNGLCTVYMHALSLNVSVGQKVSKGQTIAAVGSTGISTGNHLHFGVSLNGEYVSPWGYIG